MKHAFMKKFWKRSAALLLALLLLPVALPKNAQAAAIDRIQVDTDGGGIASKVPGSDNHVTLIAVANAGQVFDHWQATMESPGGYYGTFYGSQITVPIPAAGVTKFKAHFRHVTAKARFGIYTQVNGAHAGRGFVSGLAEAADEKTMVTATITASPYPGYAFAYWELNDGHIKIYDRSLSVSVTGKQHIYTAYFLAEASTALGVYTKVNDESYGTATGDTVFNENGGAVQQAVLQAFPKSDAYVFDHWELKRTDGAMLEEMHPSPTVTDYGAVSAANPYTVTVTHNRDEYTAVFVEANAAAGVVTAVKLVDANGTEVPGEVPGTATGARRYDATAGPGQQTALQAFPASNQYVFSHWELVRDGAAATPNPYASANPLTVQVTEHNDKYTAVFIYTPANDPVDISPSPSIDPDAFPDVQRQFTAPSYEVTRDSLQKQAKSVVADVRSRYAEASPNPGSSAAVAQLEEQLAMRRLEKEKARSEMASLPQDTLVSSDGERFYTESTGTAGYEDFADDAVRKRFGGLYAYELLQAVRVSGPGEAGDGERTLVWKNTGAVYGDRLLLLQFLPNGIQSAATPIADEDGTLTFTLKDAAGSDFLLLSVSVKPEEK